MRAEVARSLDCFANPTAAASTAGSRQPESMLLVNTNNASLAGSNLTRASAADGSFERSFSCSKIDASEQTRLAAIKASVDEPLAAKKAGIAPLTRCINQTRGSSGRAFCELLPSLVFGPLVNAGPFRKIRVLTSSLEVFFSDSSSTEVKTAAIPPIKKMDFLLRVVTRGTRINAQ
jgi:hypothetical protein